MANSVDLAKIDAAFDLAALIKGERIVFRFYLVGSNARELATRLLTVQGLMSVSILGRAVVVSFDHSLCDALGSLQIIRGAITGEKPALPGVIGCTSKSRVRRPVSRRRLARITGRQRSIRVLSDAESDTQYQTLLFVVESILDVDGTLTERLVGAIHKVLLVDAASSREYVSVLVPVTIWPWGLGRPARNLSTGFVSIVNMRDLRGGELDRKVAAHFAAGRASRVELLKRLARFGRVPRPMWHLLSLICRKFAQPGESAVVSNLGTIRDTVLEGLDCVWFFVPPVRTADAIAVGLLRMGNVLTVSVSGYASLASLRSVSAGVWKRAGIVARELSYE